VRVSGDDELMRHCFKRPRCSVPVDLNHCFSKRRPFGGPASAYPMVKRPASICLIVPNEAFVLVMFVDGGTSDCAYATPIELN
jgi:hypothetical protein